MENEEPEVSLLDYLAVIWEAKWMIGAMVFLSGLVAAIISLYVLPVQYKSSATLMPQTSQAGGAMSKLQGMAGNLPISLPSGIGGGGGGGKQTMLAFLKSRNLKKRLIKKYDLLPILYDDLWNEEIQEWEVEDPSNRPTINKALQSGAVSGLFSVSAPQGSLIGGETSNLINISSVSEDPQLTKKMINYVIDELRHYLENEYEYDAQREREFIEKQLSQAEEELEYWENQVPSDELTLSQIQRERATAQTVYTELKKQYELAKISEARDVIQFKVLDEPYVPVEKFKPARSKICLIAVFLAGFVALGLAFFRKYLINELNNRNRTPKGSSQDS